MIWSCCGADWRVACGVLKFITFTGVAVFLGVLGLLIYACIELRFDQTMSFRSDVITRHTCVLLGLVGIIDARAVFGRRRGAAVLAAMMWIGLATLVTVPLLRGTLEDPAWKASFAAVALAALVIGWARICLVRILSNPPRN